MTRSIKKGPYISSEVEKKVLRAKKSGKRETIKVWNRSTVVTPDLVGMTIAIHNGRKFIPVFISENMVGHCLGEFSPTRTFRLHSGQRQAGIKAKQ